MAHYKKRPKVKRYRRSFYSREMKLKKGIGIAVLVLAVLGIGWLEEGLLRAMASVKPGAGERVMRTLLSACSGETVRLEVASTNEKALLLYKRLGFFPTREIIRWYQVG